MHVKNIVAMAAAAFAATALSQTTFENDMSTDTSRSSVSAALMNITFTEADSRSCGNNESSSDSNALTIAIRTIPTQQVCFNVGNTFSRPESTYSMGKMDKCEENTICGVNYTITASPRVFMSDGNYSRIAYTQIRNPFATTNQDEGPSGESRVGGRLQFRVYNGANCQEKDGVKSREWNCISPREECDAVSFGVQSFSIAMTHPGEVGSGNCSIAKTSGAERLSLLRARGDVASVVGVGVAVVGAMLLLL